MGQKADIYVGKNRYPILPFRPTDADRKRIALIKDYHQDKSDTDAIRRALQGYARGIEKRQQQRAIVTVTEVE